MKTKMLNFLFICFLCPSLLLAEQHDRELLLEELDEVINQKEAYTQPKEKELSELRMRLKNAKNNRQKYELCDKLFNGYLHYQADSALVYVERKEQLLPMFYFKPKDVLIKFYILLRNARVMFLVDIFEYILIAYKL